jgi:hypothetical protein
VTAVLCAAYACTVLLAYDVWAKPFTERIAEPVDGPYLRVGVATAYALTWPAAVLFWLLDVAIRRALRGRIR